MQFVCISYFIETVLQGVNEIFKSDEIIDVELQFIKKKVKKSIESMIQQFKEKGIHNKDEIKEALKRIVVDQEMKPFDFLPQSKKIQMISVIQGMFE